MTCYLLHARREKGKRRVTRVVLDKKRPQVYALALSLSRTSWYIYMQAVLNLLQSWSMLQRRYAFRCMVETRTFK